MLPRVILPIVAAALLAPGDRLAAQNVASATLPRTPPLQEEPSLVLEPHLWRNFQPTTGAPDTTLTLLLRITAGDRRALPRGLRVERAVARADAGSWAVAFRPDEAAIVDDAFELTARGGPAWPVGAAVDVLVELRDERGRAWRLSSRARTIRRLD